MPTIKKGQKAARELLHRGVFCVDYPRGKTVKLQVRLDDAKCIKDLNRLAESVQRYSALFIPQIHHAGAQAAFFNTEDKPLCVSDKDVQHVMVKLYRSYGPQKEMTTEEIKEIVQKFINAAVNCQKANCDGVSLHAAHGYLINQFLSPDMNSRTDEYGGSFENRIRFAVEIIQGIRKACGPNFIVGARIPGHEWVPTGLTDEEIVEIAKHFEAAGCDYFDVSSGATEVSSRHIETEAYEQGDRVQYAERIKRAVKIPVGTVGALREPEFCDTIIKEGKVDFVSLGRTLICDPYWPQKAAEGKADEIKICLSCSDGCIKRILYDLSVSCALNPVAGRELEIGKLEMTKEPKNVVVIGGGIGGMQAAIAAADIGHKITLLEKSDQLGGQLNLACIPPHKERVRQAKDWFAAELVRKGVQVRLNSAADLQMIKSLNPDAIIAATGATPLTELPIEGLENTVQGWDLSNGTVPVPENSKVAIIGGGIVGCEITEMLLEKGNTVSIIEMLPQIATGLEMMHLDDLHTEFAVKKVDIHTNATAKRVSDSSITFMEEGKEQIVKADMIVLAAGQKSAGLALIKELKEEGYKVKVIGDAKIPAKIVDATLDGFYAGLSL